MYSLFLLYGCLIIALYIYIHMDEFSGPVQGHSGNYLHLRLTLLLRNQHMPAQDLNFTEALKLGSKLSRPSMASSGEDGSRKPCPLESRLWSMETLQEGLKTIQFQQMKEEDIDRDIKACHAWVCTCV